METQLFLLRYKSLKEEFPNEIPSFTQIYDSSGKIISESFNSVQLERDARKHSEMKCIEDALRVKNEKYLVDVTLYTSLEPCLQCAGAICKTKIPKVVYFLPAKRGEGISSLSWENIYLMNHFPKLIWIENQKILSDFKSFFKEKR
ncbi:tRNA-specific adenosine deaminase family protein [Leptospira ryugenii]|uniref:tRNA-specific adenosine deaminase family protein n=1 Tax=Leptospira ryugenii TaxID=1917863 RepID=A0A2P2E3E3_9LEPT|nr:nucleoside deaminase [Leptospira ryugenii]GBF51354.1 tRNA-specific adenosine deaminase family protein [Leptospira ryugenii]